MTALTIQLEDRLIDALRDAAKRRDTTIDELIGTAVSDLVGRTKASKTFRELAAEAPLSLEPGWS